MQNMSLTLQHLQVVLLQELNQIFILVLRVLLARYVDQKHGGANEVASDIQKRYNHADEAEADIRERMSRKEIIIGFGHPVYTVSDPRNEVIKRVAKQLSESNGKYDYV